MSTECRKKYTPLIIGLSVLLFISMGAVIVFGYKKHEALEMAHTTLTRDYASTKAQLEEAETRVVEYGKTLEQIQQEFAISEENGSELLKQLTEERIRNNAFEEQIEDISGTVGKLDKLAKTDPELLQKYSKVYFLNEHYMPGLVEKIPEEYLARAGDTEHIHEKVAPHLFRLIDDARDDGIDLTVVSAYRSFDEQKSLKNAYSVQYGSGANTFSADQGYSEHQLGTTVDFSISENNGSLADFEDTDAYAWLLKNAHRYGFILSYPERNGYYIFEPWHWRYVGIDLATDLHDDGKYFYDLDQREIDSYLISLFE